MAAVAVALYIAEVIHGSDTMHSYLDPLGDGKSRLALIDFMGGDLSVVNDAKASFEREDEALTAQGGKLIRYLLANEHTSPLRGTVFKFKVKAPLYVARHWFKHTIASAHADEQLGWNERSFRYTELAENDEFYFPAGFRKQAESNKQSSDELIENQAFANTVYGLTCQQSIKTYQRLIDAGVCREQARGVLPISVYTTWVWTVSLQALLHFIKLRKGHGAQAEIVLYANAVAQLAEQKAPVTFLTGLSDSVHL